MRRQGAQIAVMLGLLASLSLGAQSPTPFGIPSADHPTPAATIPAVPGSRAQGWLAQGRSEVLARHGVVATSDPLAAQAGLEIMRRGGNAISLADHFHGLAFIQITADGAIGQISLAVHEACKRAREHLRTAQHLHGVLLRASRRIRAIHRIRVIRRSRRRSQRTRTRTRTRTERGGDDLHFDRGLPRSAVGADH